MSNRNDLQYFKITGSLLTDCKEWLENVYKPCCKEIESYLLEEFGSKDFRTVRDFHGNNYIHSVPIVKNNVPYGMRVLKNEPSYMVPNAKTTKGKVYDTKFKEFYFPITCENVMLMLFGDKDTAYWGDGYYRRASIFMIDESFYFVCDVDQAISMKFDEHKELIPLLPIQMRKIKKK